MRTSSESFLWLVSAVSGLALVILLPIHLFLTHVGSLNVLSFDAVSARLSQEPVKVFYIATMVVLLIHGWLGFRGILLDLKPTRSQIQALNLIVAVIMLVTLGYAIFIIVNIP